MIKRMYYICRYYWKFMIVNIFCMRKILGHILTIQMWNYSSILLYIWQDNNTTQVPNIFLLNFKFYQFLFLFDLDIFTIVFCKFSRIYFFCIFFSCFIFLISFFLGFNKYSGRGGKFDWSNIIRFQSNYRWNC